MVGWLVGHDRVLHEDALAQQHEVKGCVRSTMETYFAPFNKLLLDHLKTHKLSPLTSDTWTHWG